MTALRDQVKENGQERANASASDRASYIRDTLVEIRKFAEDEELGFLRYLLSMALEEANVSVVVTAKHPAQ